MINLLFICLFIVLFVFFQVFYAFYLHRSLTLSHPITEQIEGAVRERIKAGLRCAIDIVNLGQTAQGDQLI